MAVQSKVLSVAVFVPERDVTSESFIRAHIAHLPFNVLPRYGLDWSIEDERGRRVFPLPSYFGAVLRRLSPGSHQAVRSLLLARHLRSAKADAVLAEYGVSGAHLATACKLAGIPLFVHFHGYDASVRDLLEQYHVEYQRMFSVAAGVVAVSGAMRDRLLGLGANARRLHVNPCGVDPERFTGAEPSKAGPHFVAVGRFVEKKAPYLTILAFRRVVDAVPEASLSVIGAGPLLGPCRRVIQALRLEDSVQLLGAQGPEVVLEQMRRARAFVQHSLVAENGDSEGTPVAVVEAQMSGLPVVGTRHAGIPDVVLDGKTGFIVEEGDIDSMASAMIRLAQDPNLAKSLGEAGRAHAVENFSLQRHISALAEMIREGSSK